MAKNKYAITFEMRGNSGSSVSGPHTKTVEAESETNAIAAITKDHKSTTSTFKLISIKQK